MSGGLDVSHPAAGTQLPSYPNLVVIGSGPAGQKAAIAAAKLRKRVAVIDRQPMIAGGSLHTGTIPSKTLREAALYLSGFPQRTFYGQDYTLNWGSTGYPRSGCGESAVEIIHIGQ